MLDDETKLDLEKRESQFGSAEQSDFSWLDIFIKTRRQQPRFLIEVFNFCGRECPIIFKYLEQRVEFTKAAERLRIEAEVCEKALTRGIQQLTFLAGKDKTFAAQDVAAYFFNILQLTLETFLLACNGVKSQNPYVTKDFKKRCSAYLEEFADGVNLESFHKAANALYHSVPFTPQQRSSLAINQFCIWLVHRLSQRYLLDETMHQAFKDAEATWSAVTTYARGMLEGVLFSLEQYQKPRKKTVVLGLMLGILEGGCIRVHPELPSNPSAVDELLFSTPQGEQQFSLMKIYWRLRFAILAHDNELLQALFSNRRIPLYLDSFGSSLRDYARLARNPFAKRMLDFAYCQRAIDTGDALFIQENAEAIAGLAGFSDAAGNTLYHLAVAKKCQSVCFLVYNAGADPLKANNKGETPLSIAGNMETLQERTIGSSTNRSLDSEFVDRCTPARTSALLCT